MCLLLCLIQSKILSVRHDMTSLHLCQISFVYAGQGRSGGFALDVPLLKFSTMSVDENTRESMYDVLKELAGSNFVV